MTFQTLPIDAFIQRIEDAADQLKAMPINTMSIYEAIDTKIDVERLLRRIVRDMKAKQEPQMRLI